MVQLFYIRSVFVTGGMAVVWEEKIGHIFKSLWSFTLQMFLELSKDHLEDHTRSGV